MAEGLDCFFYNHWMWNTSETTLPWKKQLSEAQAVSEETDTCSFSRHSLLPVQQGAPQKELESMCPTPVQSTPPITWVSLCVSFWRTASLALQCTFPPVGNLRQRGHKFKGVFAHECLLKLCSLGASLFCFWKALFTYNPHITKFNLGKWTSLWFLVFVFSF